MSSIELTPSQRTILSALVNLHREQEDAVKGETIAEAVDRNPGTIRNQMQSLKALQLVEGVPGPKGGYKPTSTAYQVLDLERMEEPASTPLFHGEKEVEGVNVREIDLTNVHHPELCRAELRLDGSVRRFHEGDAVRVGPTPLSRLVIRGIVDGKDETDNVLFLRIDGMEAPVDEPAH